MGCHHVPALSRLPSTLLPAAFSSPVTSKTLVWGIKQKLQHLQKQVMAYVCTNRWLRWDKVTHSAWIPSEYRPLGWE